ncbi:MAG: alkene reductase [Rivularia sp. (in: Bacteria)]|nr:alkene reductase [Rivularia sp. MS3]
MAAATPTKLELLSPATLGEMKLENRMILAPLTRCRAGNGFVPQAMNTIYYAQRASAGLIISEATQVARNGLGYANTPGIYNQEQIEGWKQITKAVHDKGGKIFLQLWHAGRVAHPALLEEGDIPVAPSSIAADYLADLPDGQFPHVTPRELKLEEIPVIIEQFRQGAKNALEAGFDGVEIHAGNGYLPDQFLQDNANHRTDEYGGSIENRARFLLEITQAAAYVWGKERVGVRLSPSSTFNDMHDSNPTATFSYIAEQLNRLKIAYLHVVEPRIKGNVTIEDDGTGLGAKFFRPIFKGTIIAAGGYTRDTGEEFIKDNNADFIAYGRLFVSNPDLPKRFALKAELNKYDRSTFYTSGEEGYIDYPNLK